jgi:hypothetical protein
MNEGNEKNEGTKKELAQEKLSIHSIRSILWDEIHSLRTGETSAANVSAITNATGKILSTVALQMKYAQLTGQKPDIELLRLEAKNV